MQYQCNQRSIKIFEKIKHSLTNCSQKIMKLAKRSRDRREQYYMRVSWIKKQKH